MGKRRHDRSQYLIPPGSTLQLTFAGGINDRGEIAGSAFEQATGFSPAFLAIPCDESNADEEGCQAEAQEGIAHEMSKVVLPGNVLDAISTEIIRRVVARRPVSASLARTQRSSIAPRPTAQPQPRSTLDSLLISASHVHRPSDGSCVLATSISRNKPRSRVLGA